MDRDVTGILHGTQPGWAHDQRRQWWAWYDTRGQCGGYVTDEFITRAHLGIAASAIRRRFGSLPPPMEATRP